MAIYMLEGTSSAPLPRRPLMVSLSVGGNRAGARLVARQQDSAAPPPSVVQPHPATLILPRVDQSVVILAVPDDGRPDFETGTVLHVSIGPDRNADLDADIAQLAPRDVSGLSSIELAVLSPEAGDLITVTTRLIEREKQLPPVAARARVACRGVLGMDQLPSAEQIPVSCILDASASMAGLVDNGSVAAAADIVAGIAAVVAGSSPIRALLTGGMGIPVPSGSAADLSRRLTVAIGESGYGLGADVQATVDWLGGSGGLTVVITDTPGPQINSEPGTTVVRLMLSASRLAQSYPGFTGSAFPLPPPDADAERFLNSQPHLVDQVVAGLVSPLRGR